MIVDGTAIARELRGELKVRTQQMPHRLRLGVIVAHETAQIRHLVEVKRHFGAEIGVGVEVILLNAFEQKNESLLQHLLHATRDYDGLVLQFPLPPQFYLDSVLSLFPLSHDVDVIGNTAFQQHKEGRLPFLPPAIGAMSEILHSQNITLAGRKVLVVGEGRLVGAPAVSWAQHVGGVVTVVTQKTGTLAELAPVADVIILGASSPGILTPNMVKEGVIILDAGTGESQGVVQGDADPACAAKSMIFTPTPGGLEPIATAKIFENLLTLVELKEKQQHRE
jgi:methylenetetrahydrofolate dehydrogenase (NADP+)/methenyltetrahydrofolate cyclohydrolase